MQRRTGIITDAESVGLKAHSPTILFYWGDEVEALIEQVTLLAVVWSPIRSSGVEPLHVFVSMVLVQNAC